MRKRLPVSAVRHEAERPLVSARKRTDSDSPSPKKQKRVGLIRHRRQEIAPISGCSAAVVKQGIRDWLLDNEFRMLSKPTIDQRRQFCERLEWYLDEFGLSECDSNALRGFFSYLGADYTGTAGRWNNPRLKNQVRPVTIGTYHNCITTLFSWMVENRMIAKSPLDNMKRPIVRADQIKPFTKDQIHALLAAAKASTNPRRNEAIIWILIDTGIRATELCGLRMRNLDLQARSLTVLGKGNKKRTVYFGRNAGRVLWNYLRSEGLNTLEHAEEPVFRSDRGKTTKDPLTRYGVLQIFERLGKFANLQGVRCSPHTCRHTFAIEFLRSGANIFTLREMLGHTELDMVRRYASITDADVRRQHNNFSPGDRFL